MEAEVEDHEGERQKTETPLFFLALHGGAGSHAPHYASAYCAAMPPSTGRRV